MALPKAFKSFGRLVSTILNAIAVMAICAIICAALVYSYQKTPVFLWVLAIPFFFVALASPMLILGALVENGQAAAAKMTLFLLVFWAIVFAYADMMRYLASAWQIQMAEEVRSVLQFPRYFVFHARNFFLDFWSVVTGTRYTPPILVIPEAPLVVPQNGTPWFTIKQGLSTNVESLMIGLLGSWLFQLYLDNRKK